MSKQTLHFVAIMSSMHSIDDAAGFGSDTSVFVFADVSLVAGCWPLAPPKNRAAEMPRRRPKPHHVDTLWPRLFPLHTWNNGAPVKRRATESVPRHFRLGEPACLSARPPLFNAAQSATATAVHHDDMMHRR